MRTLPLLLVAVLSGCPSAPPPREVPRTDPRRHTSPHRPAPPVATTPLHCPTQPKPAVALPKHIRRVEDLGRGVRLIVAGLRASERPPCVGACPAPSMELALVGADGTVCWRVSLPAEHRLGPVGRPGRTLWVAGPKQVFAVSWQGKRLASNPVAGPRLGLVALADGGVVTVDASDQLVAFRASGKPRWRKKPKTAEPIRAVHHRSAGGVAVAFARHVRTYDEDGVRRLQVRLPEQARRRGVAGVANAQWVWSARGAYRIVKQGVAGDVGRLRYRQPTKAPADGQVFAAVLGSKGTLYALVAERGLHPVRVLAVTPTDAVDWSRPFTGSRPAGCQMSLGPGPQLGLVCPNGRVVVRDKRGITRFDEIGKKPQLSLGPGARYAVAFETRSADMSLQCWVRRFGSTGDTAKQARFGGRCKALWHDGTGQVYLGGRRLGQ